MLLCLVAVVALWVGAIAGFITGAMLAKRQSPIVRNQVVGRKRSRRRSTSWWHPVEIWKPWRGRRPRRSKSKQIVQPR